MQQPTTTRRTTTRPKPIRLPVALHAGTRDSIRLSPRTGDVSVSLSHPLRDALLLADALTTIAAQLETVPEPAHDFCYPFRECGLAYLHARQPVVIGGREFIAARVHCGFHLNTDSIDTPNAYSSASVGFDLSLPQARQLATELRSAVAMTWSNAYAETAGTKAIDADHGDAH